MSSLIEGCPTEEQLLRALSNDDLMQWSEHVAVCPKCDAFISVIQAIRQEAITSRQVAELPSARWMLLHSEIRRRREAADQVILPLRWMAGGGFAAALVVVAAALYAADPKIFLGVPNLTDTATHASQPFGVLIAIATIPVMLLVMCVLRVIWAED
jgi:hypothetical protein